MIYGLAPDILHIDYLQKWAETSRKNWFVLYAQLIR